MKLFIPDHFGQLHGTGAVSIFGSMNGPRVSPHYAMIHLAIPVRSFASAVLSAVQELVPSSPSDQLYSQLLVL